ncbi:MAG: ferritin [Elusimicrobiaceae bacterium]|nr:ferritin [Elusimicrobiaceae bacterium]
MGLKARELVEKAKLNADELIRLLNKAYCDEWLSYYQYWIGAQLAVGIPRQHVQAELEEHAKDELDHAQRLAARIIELGGTPEIDPTNWLDHSNCGYAAPTDPGVEALLEQNVRGERCAICVYKQLLDYVRGKDMITGHLVRHILQEELEHEQDLEDIQNDIAYLCKCNKK